MGSKEDVDKMTANITRTIEEMKEEAELKGRLDIAKKMLLEGMDVQVIAKLTGIEVNKIEEVKAEDR